MTSNKQCKNCTAEMAEGDLFCASCGQKYRIAKPTLWTILGDFFSSIFNLDSEVYRSFLAIFIPGKLTSSFLNGKIKSYAPPIRVFVVSSIFFVAALSAYTNTEEERMQNDAYIYKLYRSTFIDEIDILKPKVIQHFPDTSTFLILDTLIHELTGGVRMPNTSFFIQKSQGEKEIGLTTSKEVKTVDIFKLSEDSLFQKYEIEGFFYQLVAHQQIKNIKDGDSLVNYMLGRITLLTLIMMPIVALMLKLLYWRRKRYFIEHFIFQSALSWLCLYIRGRFIPCLLLIFIRHRFIHSGGDCHSCVFISGDETGLPTKRNKDHSEVSFVKYQLPNYTQFLFSHCHFY